MVFDLLKGDLLSDSDGNPAIYSEGVHFLIPFVQKPVVLDIRAAASSFNLHIFSKDLEPIDIKFRVVHQPIVSNLPALWKAFGPNPGQTIIPPLCNEVAKKQLDSKYYAQEFLRNRSDITKQLCTVINQRSSDFYVEVLDVAMVDIRFSEDFQKKLEERYKREMND